MAAIPRLEPLSTAQVREAGAMLAAAFHDDPFSLFLLPDERSRPRWLTLLNTAGLRLALPEGHAYTIQSGGAPGVIALVPPGRYPLPAWRSLRFLASVALRPPPFGPPLRSLVRGLQALRLVERLHVKEPHWYVHALGVHPNQQGKGLGRALLDPALALADRDRLPTYLETSNPRNLTFYGHFGFEMVEEVRTPGGGPPIWRMLRPPVG
ncbi:MAG TPA: GNAT family N-acetyltransferase [Dehalococcoidia bacterium]|nr:GNAT family N-acetyltransferase [Dehalococcoidia bacterium]